MEVGVAIEWLEASNDDKSKTKDKVTLCFFGECGTGKSTDLSLIARIYAVNHKEDCKGQQIEFVSG